jgi:hypothetical protein
LVKGTAVGAQQQRKGLVGVFEVASGSMPLGGFRLEEAPFQEAGSPERQLTGRIRHFRPPGPKWARELERVI